EAVTEFGFVLTRTGRKARGSTPSGERTAEIAPGCLISPAPGDPGLVARAGGGAHVPAVLRQQREGESRIVFDQDVSLDLLKGRLRILAQDGIDLVSPREVSAHAGRVAATAEEIRASFSLLDLVGQSLATKTKKVRVVAETFDTIAGRLYQRAVNFLR